ncbi:TPA: hypothetical protein ACH3X1_000346 [Trebouxia sp. C0004]
MQAALHDALVVKLAGKGQALRDGDFGPMHNPTCLPHYSTVLMTMEQADAYVKNAEAALRRSHVSFVTGLEVCLLML